MDLLLHLLVVDGFIAEDTHSSEVVVPHPENVDVVPAVEASKENLLHLIKHSKLDVLLYVSPLDFLLATAEYVKE